MELLGQLIEGPKPIAESPAASYFDSVTESLRIRKQKMLDRKRDRRLLAQGKLRVDQVCLAASAQMSPKPPLIFRKVKLADDEGLGDG